MKGTSLSLSGRRYALAPQMRDYDTLEEKVWLPYVMTFQRPLCNTPSFSTDAYGFRGTLWKGKRLGWTEYNDADHSRAALIGGSVAFGVGASSDAFTLASLLNERQERVWFNLAGRGFNSTQELLIFLLYLPRTVETVLLLSGINNLALSYLSQSVSPVYNSFYAQSVFERGLNRGQLVGVGGTLRLLAQEIGSTLFPRGFSPGESRKAGFPSSNGKAPGVQPDKVEDILQCFRRDMRLWALLRDAMGFRLTFVFQPLATWIDKAFTPEEQEVFSILDQDDPLGSWSGIVAHLQGEEKRYVSEVRDICRSLSVPFLNLNACPSFREKRWLFVDRAHLTNEGYALCAEEISKECFR